MKLPTLAPISRAAWRIANMGEAREHARPEREQQTHPIRHTVRAMNDWIDRRYPKGLWPC
jgi:hypothetical protein